VGALVDNLDKVPSPPRILTATGFGTGKAQHVPTELWEEKKCSFFLWPDRAAPVAQPRGSVGLLMPLLFLAAAAAGHVVLYVRYTVTAARGLAAPQHALFVFTRRVDE